MPWSSGSYSKANNATGGWVGDASLGIGIEAGRHDNQDNDFATGINQCLNKDGSNSATGNLNLGGFLPTNIGAGTAAAPAICAGNDVNTGIFSAAADQIGIATNGTERMRITSAGRVGIGTTAPSGLLTSYSTTSTIPQIFAGGLTTGSGGSGKASLNLDVNGNGGWLIENDATGGVRALTISDNNGYGSGTIERLRIRSDGNVGLGNAGAATTRLEVKGSDATSSNFAFITRDSNNNHTFYTRNDGLINTGVQTSSPYNLTTVSGSNLYVDANGTLFRSTTSSLKYKTDVQDTPHGLAEVLQLRPVTYKGINDGDTVFGGLIAEEVNAVGLTEFVVYAQDGSPDALNYGNMVSLAFKAIQELNAKVESLQARVAELEA